MEVEPKRELCDTNQTPEKIPPLSLHHASSSDALGIVEAPENEEPIVNGTNNKDKVDDDGYLDSFPPGYRFCPLDEELVLYYLKKKVLNLPLPQNRIVEVNLYQYNPERLAELYKQYGEKEWYFFTPRDKKYRNGTRPNRAAVGGYWKATGADREVRFKDRIVGYRKALVFYKGRPPKGDKTSWIMHEYRVNDPPPLCSKKEGYTDMRLDDYVLCRIYKKVDKSGRTQTKTEDGLALTQKQERDEMMGSEDTMNYLSTVGMGMGMGGNFMNQAFPEFQYIFNDQFPSSFPTKYLNDRLEQEDVWSFDFPPQLDVSVEALINVDNVFSPDTATKNSTNSEMNTRD
ncbi:hypothetical protein ES288_D09G138100v1 [Gossypium darwinii]|uniref:NAC domain-containing protein n=1 Tax=Gossypium darwinii TaxID=34276 RepID=A0A5D2BB99_GOSDA|nr:hypothetical protein ES288_D09G138100v1 [Gossypium darwinii]